MENPVVRWLKRVALEGRPKKALAAYRALARSYAFDPDARRRFVQLLASSRPGLLAEVWLTHVRVHEANCRYENGRFRQYPVWGRVPSRGETGHGPPPGERPKS